MDSTKQHFKEYAMNGYNRRANTLTIKEDSVTVDGIRYNLTDMVPRPVAQKISTLDYSYFSSRVSAGDIFADGRGAATRYLVADCLKVNLKKHAKVKQVA